MDRLSSPRPGSSTDARHVGVSATEPDFSREQGGGWISGPALMRALRAYERGRARGGVLGWLICRIASVRHRLLSLALGAEVPLGTRIGGGLLLPHPNGVVIHPGVSLGPNCLVFQQVTLGANVQPGLPRIGGHVDIGAGAKILGGVTIGDHVRIGANAVVVCDVPSGATAVGVPARIIQRAD